MATWGATYHIHVHVGSIAGSRNETITVNRTRWTAGRPGVSGEVAKVCLGELTVPAGSPLEQAVACAEAALAALQTELACQEVDAV